MIAVIPAAGSGNRLGMNKPKGFLNIYGKPLIEYSLQALAMRGIHRVFIITGYQSLWYRDYIGLCPLALDVNFVHNDKFDITGSMYSISLIKNYVQEDVLLLDSDILYDPNCINILLNHPSPDVVLLGNEKNQKDCVYVQHDIKMSKNKNEVNPIGVLVGIAKISYETWKQVMDYACDPRHHHEHHDWAFMHTKNKFVPLVLNDLIFTEIDDDDQLSYAINHVYPKI